MNKFKDIEKNVCEFTGVIEVAAGLSEYRRELAAIDATCQHNDPEKVREWVKENRFFVFINKETKKIIGFRVTGEAEIRPWRFLFATDYIPVACAPDVIPPQASPSEVSAIVNTVLEHFECEVRGMFVAKALPLFLLHHAGNDTYIAWSMLEGKYVGVYDYKSFRHDFSVEDISSGASPVPSAGRYVIIPPSDALIKALGLSLDSSAYHIKVEDITTHKK